MEASSDIVSREASSVEDPEGVGNDPGVGHEPGVDPEVEDGLMVVVIFVVTFVLLLELLNVQDTSKQCQWCQCLY